MVYCNHLIIIIATQMNWVSLSHLMIYLLVKGEQLCSMLQKVELVH